jgi:hypothetical protein
MEFPDIKDILVPGGVISQFLAGFEQRPPFANMRCFSTKHIGKDESFLLRYRFIKELN